MSDPTALFSPPVLDLPSRMWAARRAKGFTQADIAEAIGVHRRTVSNWESGATCPDRPALLAWAIACEVPMWWLAGGDCPHT